MLTTDHFRRLLACIAGLAITSGALADYEAPNPVYAPPSNYYAAAAGTGSVLRMNLHNIISSGFVSRSYGDARYAFAVTDADPNHAGNIRLLYNDASVPSTWDSGLTYNREHIFCQSWLGISVSNSYKGPGSDLFELRPCSPSVNSSRGNDPYGLATSSGIYGHVSSSWYPGDTDAGQVARSLFYMATRYYNGTGTASLSNLDVINGSWQLYKAADLNSLLHWNYKHGVDNFERRRNQYIYSSTLNPSYYQGNRNPYIDHPEFVWAVFGGGNNDSTIYVSPTIPADGTSSQTADLGRIIRGGSLSTASVTINKSGTGPTTYDVLVSGEASTTAAGTGQPFDYGNQSRTVSVGLNASAAATPGLKTGTITIDNTDLTSAGAGMGINDGNDTILVTAAVLEHAQPSLRSAGVEVALVIDCGDLLQHTGPHQETFSLSNLERVAGYTAALDLDAVNVQGDSDVLWANVAPFRNLPAGQNLSYSVQLNGDTVGDFQTTYALTFSDADLPGATGGYGLTLTLKGRVIAGVPNLPGDIDGDGHVNLADLKLLVAAWNTTPDSSSWNPAADIDGDHAVSLADLKILVSNWGRSAG